MEYYDILDQQGNPTGRIEKKGNFNGNYYLGVHCYIEDLSGQFLIQKRASSKKFLPDTWDIHYGHVMAGESSLQGVKREVLEEVGLERSQEDYHLIRRLRWSEPKHFTDIYHLKTNFSLSDITIQEDELSDVKLISRKEMIDLIEGMDHRPEDYREIVIDFIQ